MSKIEKVKTTTDLTTAPQVKTANQVMMNLEDEIEAIKNGTLPPDKARLVMQGRRQQLKVIELALAAMRLDQRMRPIAAEYFIVQGGKPEDISEKTADKAA